MRRPYQTEFILRAVTNCAFVGRVGVIGALGIFMQLGHEAVAAAILVIAAQVSQRVPDSQAHQTARRPAGPQFAVVDQFYSCDHSLQLFIRLYGCVVRPKTCHASLTMGTFLFLSKKIRYRGGAVEPRSINLQGMTCRRPAGALCH